MAIDCIDDGGGCQKRDKYCVRNVPIFHIKHSYEATFVEGLMVIVILCVIRPGTKIY